MVVGIRSEKQEVLMAFSPTNGFHHYVANIASGSSTPLICQNTYSEWVLPYFRTLVCEENIMIDQIVRHLRTTLQIVCKSEDIYLSSVQSRPNMEHEVLHIFRLRNWHNHPGTVFHDPRTTSIVPLRTYTSTRWMRANDHLLAIPMFHHLFYYLYELQEYRHTEYDTDLD